MKRKLATLEVGEEDTVELQYDPDTHKVKRSQLLRIFCAGSGLQKQLRSSLPDTMVDLEEGLLHLAMYAKEDPSLREGWRAIIGALLSGDRKVPRQRVQFTEEQRRRMTRLHEDLSRSNGDDAQRKMRRDFLLQFNKDFPERQLTSKQLYSTLHSIKKRGGWLGAQALTSTGRDDQGRTVKGFSVGDTKGSQLLEAARVSTLLRQQTGWWVDQSTLVVKIPKHEQIRDLWCRNYDTHLAQDSESNICDFVDQTTDKTEMAIYSCMRRGTGRASLQPGAENLKNCFQATLSAIDVAMAKYVEVLGGGSPKRPVLKSAFLRTYKEGDEGGFHLDEYPLSGIAYFGEWTGGDLIYHHTSQGLSSDGCASLRDLTVKHSDIVLIHGRRLRHRAGRVLSGARWALVTFYDLE